MDSQPAPPEVPSTIAGGSPRTASDELEQYQDDYAGENTQRSRKRTKFVSLGDVRGCSLFTFPINGSTLTVA